jgi:hypothetical protein
MTKNVFPLKEAGDFFNEHFINVMFDMEQAAGMEINTRYTVTNYPTYLLLTPEGEERYRLVGRDELPRFIERISRGLDEKNALPVLEKEYASGKMTKERFVDYLLVLDDAHRHQTLQQVFSERASVMTPEEKADPAFWPALSNPRANPYSLENLRFVFDHARVLGAGDASIDAYLSGGYDALLTAHLSGKAPVEEAAGLIALVREQVTARPITSDMVRFKLAISEALLHREFERAVVLFGENIAQFTLMDFSLITGIFNRIDTKEKAIMEKVAAISLETIPDANFKIVMKNYIDHLKTKAN